MRKIAAENSFFHKRKNIFDLFSMHLNWLLFNVENFDSVELNHIQTLKIKNKTENN